MLGLCLQWSKSEQEKQQLGEALARFKDAHAQEGKRHAAELMKLHEQVSRQSSAPDG